MALSKGTATDYQDLLDELDAFIVADWVDTIAINAGGTGYTVGDILTVAGGTVTHHAAQIIVTSVSSGVIDGARLHDSGGYSADPTTTANAVTGGTGSSATFDLTMESDPYTIELSSTIETTEEVRIYQGSGGGGVFFGLRTYQEDTGAREARNWAIFGMSSYNGGLDWWDQPDIDQEAGFSTVDGTMGTAAEGKYMVLKDNDGTAMDYWFYVTNRRIIVQAKLVDGVTTTPRYSSCYMGLLNPMGTSDEFPYPLIILGSACDSSVAWDNLSPANEFTGITQLIGRSLLEGPGAYYSVDGTWKTVKNTQQSSIPSSNRSESNTYTLYPCGQMNPIARPSGEDIIVDNASTGFQWEHLIQMTNFTASTVVLYPTPDSGGEKRLLVPTVLTLSNNVIDADYHIVGELDGVYWIGAEGTTTATPEDTTDDALSSDVYTIFPNGAYAQQDGFMAIRET